MIAGLKLVEEDPGCQGSGDQIGKMKRKVHLKGRLDVPCTVFKSLKTPHFAIVTPQSIATRVSTFQNLFSKPLKGLSLNLQAGIERATNLSSKERKGKSSNIGWVSSPRQTGLFIRRSFIEQGPGKEFTCICQYLKSVCQLYWIEKVYPKEVVRMSQ